jgi:hypothetical protein
MKYWIRIHNSERGPYSPAEITSSFGPSLPCNTPCAEVGKDTWSTLGELLPQIGSASPIPEAPQAPSPNVDAVANGFIKKAIAAPVLVVTGFISAPIFIRYDRTNDTIWGWLFFIVIVLGVSASIIIPAYVLAKHGHSADRSVFRDMPLIRYFFRNGAKDSQNPFIQKQ